MNSVASGFRAHIKNGIANARRLAEKDLVPLDQSERECIDEWVKGISIVESDLAPNSGHAKRITIVSDPTDNAGEQRAVTLSVLRVVKRTKAQAVHCGNRSRTHGENVAQNAANAS